MIFDEMVTLFEKANAAFLGNEADHILTGVSERNLCGTLMGYLRKELDLTNYRQYHVEVEYNRNNGKLKTIVDGSAEAITIQCDLIVHSRGKIVSRDNLIAVEMKRHTHLEAEKNKDRNRLTCLTKDSFDDVWSFDGTVLPEHVCLYVLGVYYELNNDKREATVEYYAKGRMVASRTFKF